jgi:hypothetical protein
MNTTTEPTTLILAGSGYELTISPAAERRKAELLEVARSVQYVRDNDESADAQYHSRSLAALRIEVEKCRKIIKEPVNRIGKLIDLTATNFIEAVSFEEKRIAKLIGNHAEEVERLKAEKEAAERQAFDAARAAREAADAALDAAETTGKISDIIAAKRAEKERQDALAARMEASEEVATTNVAQGVRFAWDFEVTDIEILYAMDRTLVEVTPRRAAILAMIRDTEAFEIDPVALFATLGIKVFKKPVVSTR